MLLPRLFYASLSVDDDGQDPVLQLIVFSNAEDLSRVIITNKKEKKKRDSQPGFTPVKGERSTIDETCADKNKKQATTQQQGMHSIQDA